jgi:hypothetical protein
MICTSVNISVFVHIAEDLLHGCVADGPLEEDVFDALRGHGSEQWQHEQQSAEASGVGRVSGASVLPQHHLCLVLQVLYLQRILQPSRLYNRPFYFKSATVCEL